MNRYRVVLTFRASSPEEAAAIASDPERMPRGSKMQVVNVDRRRMLRQAGFLGMILAFWLGLAAGVMRYWK